MSRIFISYKRVDKEKVFRFEHSRIWKKSITYIHDGLELPIENWSESLHSFDDLTSIIRNTHDAAQTSAIKAINRMQTMRNWLIGYNIVEFEQHGKDRAEYGSGLLKKLEAQVNRKGLTETLFKWARKFYQFYPKMEENFIGEISMTASCNLFETKSQSVVKCGLGQLFVRKEM